jgi:hypothetical protein
MAVLDLPPQKAQNLGILDINPDSPTFGEKVGSQESDYPTVQESPILPPGTPVDRVIEPAAAAVSGVGANIVGGLKSIPTAAMSGVDAGVNAIESTQEALTVQPKTRAGQEGLETLSDVLATVSEIGSLPFVVLEGMLTKLVTGDDEEAHEAMREMLQKGVGQKLGDDNFEMTGSPAVGTAAFMTPELLLSLLGLRHSPKKPKEIAAQEEAPDIIQAGKQQEIDVLTSDLRQPETFVEKKLQQFSEQFPLIGTGKKRSEQQEQRVDAVRRLDESLPETTAKDIFDSLVQSANKRKSAAGSRLGDIRDQLTGPEMGSVPMNNTIRAFRKAINDLQASGKIKDPDLIRQIEEIKQTALDAGENFESLRRFRTSYRQKIQTENALGDRLVTTEDEVIIDSIYNALTKDLDRFVAAKLGDRVAARYKQADTVYREEVNEIKKSRLKNAINKGDVVPELVEQMLFSSKPSEVALLYKRLNTEGRNHARVALLKRALRQSETDGEFSPVKFVGQLAKLQRNFDVIFKGDAKAEIEGLRKVLIATKRAQEAGVQTPTGQQLIPWLAVGTTGAAVAGSPGATAAIATGATLATLYRAYESSGVRDTLIKLGKSSQKTTVDKLGSLPLMIQQMNESIEAENGLATD